MLVKAHYNIGVEMRTLLEENEARKPNMRNRYTFTSWSFLLLASLLFWTCNASQIEGPISETRQTIPLQEIKKAEVAALNSDLVPGKLTMDVGLIIPSNFHPDFKLVSAEKLLDGIKSAKEIYNAVDVQINLLWLKTGPFEEDHLAIQANENPAMPGIRHLKPYERMWRANGKLTAQTQAAFESVIEPHPDNHRTLYIVALEEVFFSFFAELESADYQLLVSPTSGFSFPPYIYGRNMPKHLSGIISISNLTNGPNRFKTIAHEIGHKAMNVSHEYRDIKPEFEVFGEGGLMIYGSGTEIPSGAEGLWHKERLFVSPFVYRLNDQGEKEWNPAYEQKGYYYDPIYGDFMDK